MRELQDESCGLLAQRTKPGTLATMCHASINSADLRVLLNRCMRFFSLVNDDIDSHIGVKGGSAMVTLNVMKGTADVEGHIIMVMLGIIHRLAGWVIGEPLTLERVCIARGTPVYANDYNVLFETAVTFGAERNVLQFSEADD